MDSSVDMGLMIRHGSIVDVGVHHSILPLRGGTGGSRLLVTLNDREGDRLLLAAWRISGGCRRGVTWLALAQARGDTTSPVSRLQNVGQQRSVLCYVYRVISRLIPVVEVLVIIQYSALVVRTGYTGNVVVLRVACTKWWSHLFVEVAWIQ